MNRWRLIFLITWNHVCFFLGYSLSAPKEIEQDSSVVTDFVLSKFFENSIPLKIYHESIELSAKFSLSENNFNKDISTFELSERYELSMKVKPEKSYWDISIRSEIAYTFILDSLWKQSEDVFSLSVFRLNDSGSRLNQTFSLSLKTKLLPDKQIQKASDGQYKSISSAKFFNPGNVHLSYGYTWRFWEICLLNFSLATIKVESIPVYEYPNDEHRFGYYKRTWNLDYGFSLNIKIEHNFNKRLKWQHQSFFFVNSLQTNSIRFDLNNQIRYLLGQHLSLTVSTKLDYNLLLSPKMMLRQDFRLGFIWSLD